nr:peptidoglycan-binding protein [Myxococcus sp. MH1]
MPSSPESVRIAALFDAPTRLPAARGVPLKGRGLDPLETAMNLEENLQVLEQHAGLVPLSELTPSSQGANYERYKLVVRAVRLRLSHLGYDVGAPTSDKMDAALLKGLNPFRVDIGLAPSGATIEQATWDALQELVTLEDPLDIDRWYPAHGVAKPVLLRAAQLRLTTLGLRDNVKVDPSDANNLRIQLARFRAVMFELGLTASSSITERETLRLLMSHDELLEKVAQGTPELRSFLPERELEEKKLPTASRRFLLRLARNELWLNGYPLGDIREPVIASKLRKALDQYWRNSPARPTFEALVLLHTTQVTPALFEDFVRQQREEDVSSDDLVKFVENNQAELQDYWTSEVDNSDFFLWDGIKRTFKWLKRQVQRLGETVVSIFRSVGEFFKTLARNVFRSLFQVANDVLGAIGRAATAFADGVGIFLSGQLLPPAPRLDMGCRLNMDCDTVLFIDAQASVADARQLLGRLERVSAAIGLAGAVLSLVIRLVSRAVSGVIGWLLLIATLVQAAPEIIAKVSALAALG